MSTKELSLSIVRLSIAVESQPIALVVLNVKTLSCMKHHSIILSQAVTLSFEIVLVKMKISN